MSARFAPVNPSDRRHVLLMDRVNKILSDIEEVPDTQDLTDEEIDLLVQTQELLATGLKRHMIWRIDE